MLLDDRYILVPVDVDINSELTSSSPAIAILDCYRSSAGKVMASSSLGEPATPITALQLPKLKSPLESYSSVRLFSGMIHARGNVQRLQVPFSQPEKSEVVTLALEIDPDMRLYTFAVPISAFFAAPDVVSQKAVYDAVQTQVEDSLRDFGSLTLVPWEKWGHSARYMNFLSDDALPLFHGLHVDCRQVKCHTEANPERSTVVLYDFATSAALINDVKAHTTESSEAHSVPRPRLPTDHPFTAEAGLTVSAAPFRRVVSDVTVDEGEYIGGAFEDGFFICRGRDTNNIVT